MTEINGLYDSVLKETPFEIKKHLDRISSNNRQEALDIALEKAITLTTKPKAENVRFLLQLGANSNGVDSSGMLLNYAYSGQLMNIVELLLSFGANVNAPKSNVLEAAVRRGDLMYVVRFVSLGADIFNTDRLLYGDNLFELAAKHPLIQKYLYKKGLGKENESFANLKTPQVADFNFKIIEKTASAAVESPSKQSTNILVTELDNKRIIVRGNTKEIQKDLHALGGLYSKAHGGWILPAKNQTKLNGLIAKTATASASVDHSDAVLAVQQPQQRESQLLDLINGVGIERPVVKAVDRIEIYTPLGEWGQFANDSVAKFKLNGHEWDTIERYLMHEMYISTFKGDSIKNAETLNEARYKFGVTSVPQAKTPKQLVLNQKLIPLAESKINPKFYENFEKIFFQAIFEKLSQNKLIMKKLLETGEALIINRNVHDLFGYESNMLGNTLMAIRNGQKNLEQGGPKTNNMTIKKYPGNKNFYVIRGNPTPELATQIRNLSTYKTKTGKIVHGKLNLNLAHGPGWLIPLSQRNEAKKLIFDTYPDEYKIELCGQAWIKEQIKIYLYPAIVFSKYRNRLEVGADDIMFSIKEIFDRGDLLGGPTNDPHLQFSKVVIKYVTKHEITISDSAVQLLWNVLSKLFNENVQDIQLIGNYKAFKDKINFMDATLLETPIATIDNLTERETIIVRSFVRIFKLLKKTLDTKDESKICIAVIHIMLDKNHYELVRSDYSKKLTEDKKTASSESLEIQLRHRFGITCKHIATILTALPENLSKKCIVLFFSMLDYVMAIEGEPAIHISKKLILLSQVKNPTPAPAIDLEIDKIETPRSDIPKISSVAADAAESEQLGDDDDDEKTPAKSHAKTPAKTPAKSPASKTPTTPTPTTTPKPKKDKRSK